METKDSDTHDWAKITTLQDKFLTFSLFKTKNS